MIYEEFEKKAKEIEYPKEDIEYKGRIDYHKAMIEEIKKVSEYKRHEKQLKYREAHEKLNNEFELALYKEYDVEFNPKRKKVFYAAWERGHSSGYHDVEQYFSEYVELIK